MSTRTSYLLEQNLIVKAPLPRVGIICSNNRRTERLVNAKFKKIRHLKEYHSAWHLDIYLGQYKGKNCFAATVPVGAAGASFAIQQFASAGCQYLIRYGSNDMPNLTEKHMEDIIIVDQADNLYGLMQGSGAPEEIWGKTLHASPLLISALQVQAACINKPVYLALCHHVEDYAAYAFPSHAGPYQQTVLKTIKKLEAKNPDRLHSRDMETAALFWRAELDGFHAATVLQNIPKFPGKHQTYEGERGEKAKTIENIFFDLICETLINFTD